MRLSYNFTIPITFWLRQEIIVPFAVRIGPKIWSFICFSNDAHITFAACDAINRVELILLSINLQNGLFTGHPPFIRQISDVRDVLMRTWVMRLVDTGDLVFCHNYSFVLMFRLRKLRSKIIGPPK